jgi:O-antigen/teichoic acid export membrane protein
LSLSNKIKSAGSWQILQIVVQSVSQFVYIAIMARLLSKADFGLMALALSFIGIGTIFSEGGMGASLIQKKDISQKHMNAALQGGIVIGLFVFVILFFTAPSIALFFDQPQLELIIKVAGVNVVLTSASSVSLNLLQKKFKFRQTTNVKMLVTLVGYLIGILLAYRDWGVWSLVVTNLTISFLGALLLFYYAPVKFSLKINLKEWKELFSFGFGITLLKINNYIGNQGLSLILGTILTPALLGVFERTYRIKDLPSTYLGNVLDTVMFPVMSEIQDEQDRLFRVYQHSLGIVNSLLMPIAIYLIYFSEEIVLILLGDNWLDTVLPLQIMLIPIPFSSSGRIADSVICAKGFIYKNVLRKFIYVIVLITTVSIGAFFYGLIGAAIAITFSYFFNYSIMLILIKNIFRKSLKEIFLKPIWSGIKLSLIVFFLLILFVIFLDYFDINSIYKFIANIVLITFSVFLLVRIKPTIMGIYLYETYNRLIIKNN